MIRQWSSFVCCGSLALLTLFYACSWPSIGEAAQPEDSLISNDRDMHDVSPYVEGVAALHGTYDLKSEKVNRSMTNNEMEALGNSNWLRVVQRRGAQTAPPMGATPSSGPPMSGPSISAPPISAPPRAGPTIPLAQFGGRNDTPSPYQFTIRVPIQLQNLHPDIDKMKVKCWTFHGEDATKFENRIGEGQTIKEVVGLQLDRIIVVRFDAINGKDPEDADRYHCSLTFHKLGIGFRKPQRYGSVAADKEPSWIVSEEAAPFKIDTHGNLH